MKRLLSSIVAVAAALTAGSGFAEDVTAAHDKAFYQSGFDDVAGVASASDIEVEFSAFNIDNFQAFIQTGLISGNAPPVFTWWNGTRLEEIVASGQLAPLDELWEQKVASGAYSEADSEPFTVDGKIYGMPMGLNSWVVLYNKEQFKEAGIDAPPGTWDELISAADKLKTAGITPFNATIQDGWRGFIWFEELMIRTDPEAYDQLNRGEIAYNSEPVKNAFEIWTDFYAKGYFTDPTSQEEPLDFARGKAAMYLIGDWAIGLVEAAGMTPVEDFGVFIMPNQDSSLPNTVIVEASPIVVTAEGMKDPRVHAFADLWMSTQAMNSWATDPGLYAGNLQAKVPNDLIGEISKIKTDGNYKGLVRYWEASPSDIVLPAVEEFHRFMTDPSPESAERAMDNIEQIASTYWASRN